MTTAARAFARLVVELAWRPLPTWVRRFPFGWTRCHQCGATWPDHAAGCWGVWR